MTAIASGSWGGATERLDRVLPALGLARSRSQATELISQGKVRADGEVVTKAGTKIAEGTTVSVEGGDHYVSRAAQKLLAGLDAFAHRDGYVRLGVRQGFHLLLVEESADGRRRPLVIE